MAARWRILLTAAAILAAPALSMALDVGYDIDALGQLRIAENRRNPGNMAPLAAGDFNGDGYGDIAMGSPRSAAFLTANSGNVFILFGRSFLVPTPDDLFFDLTARPDAVANGLFSALFADPTKGAQVFPERGGEQFGSAVAAGDFDNDGYDDLAIGAPALFGGSAPGAVYLLYGRPDLAGVVAIDTEIFNDRGFEIKGDPGTSYFGEHLFMDDLNNDGYSELAIGSPRDPFGRAVAVVFGRDRFPLIPAMQLGRSGIGGTQGVWSVLGADPTHLVGFAFAAGDYTGDSMKELFVGAPNWPGGISPRGRVMGYVVTDPLDGVIAVNVDITDRDYRGTEVTGEFGRSLAFGSFEAPGSGDLVIGVPGAVFGRGLVYITQPIVDGAAAVTFPGPEEYSFGTTVNGSRLGTSVALQPFDSRAGADLIVGAPGVTNAADEANAGKVYVVTGGLSASGYDIDTSLIPGIAIEGFPGEMEAGTYLAFTNFDNVSPTQEDLVIGGSGLYTYDSACTSGIQSDWDNCHAAQVGVRTFLLRAGTLADTGNTSHSGEQWMMLP